MRTGYGSFHRAAVVAALATLALACERRQERAADGVDTASAAAVEIDRSGADIGGRVDVTLSEWAIEQSADSVARGQATFAVANAGTMPHSLEISGPGGKWSSPPIPPGGRVLMSMLVEPGQYELSCPDDAGEHKGQGMTGRITVH